MIVEDVGKLLVNTQDEIKVLRSELDIIQSPFRNSSKEEYMQMLNKIKDQLSQFEHKFSKKIEHLTNQTNSNYDVESPNKLPQIKAVGSRDLLMKSATIKPDQICWEEAKIQKKIDPRLAFWQKLASNPCSPVTKKYLQHKFSLPQELPKKAILDSTLKPIFKYKIKGKVSKPVGILPKMIRDNPFALPPITEHDVKQGVLSLIDRGLVPKEVDLTPAFERGSSTLKNQKMKLHNHREQFMKVENNSVPGYIYNVKLDVKGFNESGLYKLGEKILLKSDRLSQDFTDINYISTQEPSFEASHPKDYEEVLDLYSLHQFIIHKGKVLADTPEFQSYKRTYFGIWESIELLIKALEKTLIEYEVSLAYVDGKKLARLAEISVGKPAKEELIACIANPSDIRKLIKMPEKIFKGSNGQNRAATKIQSVWRMYRVKKNYNKIRLILGKISIIQSYARMFLQRKRTLNLIKTKREEKKEKYKDIFNSFQTNWPHIKLTKRVEIHLMSLDYDKKQRDSVEHFLQKQNAQITRLFALKDPLVEIIYVAPFELPAEVISYYSRVFELGGLEDYQKRYTIIWPEKNKVFTNPQSTSRALLYSPKMLKQIRQLIQGKVAYIVPSYPSNDDLELALALNVPLFSGHPQKNTLYSLKSGAQQILKSCGVPIPTGSYCKSDEKEVILTLTMLIAHNFYVNTWIFKIDNEFNGRGHASFSIDQIRSLVELRNQKLTINEELVLKIQEIITRLLPDNLKISMPHHYTNYNEYIKNFVQKGGIIEAAPNCPPTQIASASVAFVIDPVGDIEVIGSYDKLFLQEFTAIGYLFPQKSMPNLNLQSLCETVGKALYEKGVFGYITLDMISFPDPSAKEKEKKENTGERIFWVVDLNCYMTTYITSTFFFEFLMAGNLDKVSGSYTIQRTISENGVAKLLKAEKAEKAEGIDVMSDKEKEKRCFMYCPFVFHPSLASIQYKTFFHMCRTKGISYDLESKTGTTFILLDALQTGIMGLLTIGKQRKNVVKYMNEATSFILNQASELKSKGLPEKIKPDSMYLLDIANKLKLINRNFEKRSKKTKEFVNN